MIVSKGIKEELKWFHDLKFGMFVHFGIYSLLGKGEWAMLREGIPKDEYVKLAEMFNPFRFNAQTWVALARDAGAKYITVTTKHHDGFCLFDSALTEYKITNTPFGRDLIGELIDECHKKDMRVILYYSQPDWHHTSYVHNKGAFKDLNYTSVTERPDWTEYIKYYMGQIEELCTKYGRIDGIWFDGSHKTVEEWKGREVYEMIKKYHPHAVVNDRARYGDFFTPERSLPENLTGYLFESCESISPEAWGHRENSAAYSVPYLVKNLVKLSSSGGNYLLNVGPLPDGTIPEIQAQVMKEIGKWLQVNGKAVYNANPVFLDLPKDIYGMTTSGKYAYLLCFDWPDRNKIIIPGIETDVKAVKLLGNGADISFKQTNNELVLIDLPCMPPNVLVQVFELEFCENPTFIEKTIPIVQTPVITINPVGRTNLEADKAEFKGLGVKGAKLYLEELPGKSMSYIKGWFVPEQEAVWKIDCTFEGEYRLSVSAASLNDGDDTIMKVTAGGKEMFASMTESTNMEFTLVDIGTVTLPCGTSIISIKPEKLKWGYIFGIVEKIVIEKV